MDSAAIAPRMASPKNIELFLGYDESATKKVRMIYHESAPGKSYSGSPYVELVEEPKGFLQKGISFGVITDFCKVMNGQPLSVWIAEAKAKRR